MMCPVDERPTPRTLSLGAGGRVPYPEPTSAAVTASMKGNTSRDTKAEVLLRSTLHARGRRFRKNIRVAGAARPHRADIVFTKARVAVFVDGCFWHGCPTHGRRPKANTGYWDAKLARNTERDRQTDTDLAAAGWTVVRVWEHEPVEVAATAVEAALDAR